MSLATQVLIGFIVGVASGVFFGIQNKAWERNH
jgi:Na+/H+-dicarboxylate symporter